jgi:hypothetical protein
VGRNLGRAARLHPTPSHQHNSEQRHSLSRQNSGTGTTASH